jgi:nicotinate-nucleotide adenylyltransferase
MVKLAIADKRGFMMDERELHRAGPSYMVDTLISLRAEVGTECAISLVMGMDAYLSLPTWHKWQEVVTMSHLIVMERVMWGKPAHGVLADLHEQHGTTQAKDLSSTPAGRVTYYDGHSMDVSASEIRKRIKQRDSVHYLLPEPVWDYIRVHGLYL